jgi:DNA-binding CsgD family transcriptional regulator
MDNASIALLQMLLPHAHIALQIHAKLRAENIHNRFAELTLHTMSAAVFLVSAGGQVQYMNQLAVSCIEKKDGLLLKGALLTASNPTENAKLKLFILGVVSVRTNGTQNAPGGALSITRQRSQSPLHLVVLPVPENSKLMVLTPCALVFVSDPAAVPKSRATLMRMIYGLTPTESRFADLLLEGLIVREVADRLGITIETARFHLKRVLAKTATHRQTELMRIMLLLPEIT